MSGNEHSKEFIEKIPNSAVKATQDNTLDSRGRDIVYMSAAQRDISRSERERDNLLERIGKLEGELTAERETCLRLREALRNETETKSEWRRKHDLIKRGKLEMFMQNFFSAVLISLAGCLCSWSGGEIGRVVGLALAVVAAVLPFLRLSVICLWAKCFSKAAKILDV